MVPAVWRRSKKEDMDSLLEEQGPRSSTQYRSNPMKKKGVFARLRKKGGSSKKQQVVQCGHHEYYDRTPPVTPDEKYDVAVVASEYVPSRSYYAPSPAKAVAPYPVTQIRKVEFKESARPPPLFSQQSSYPTSHQESSYYDSAVSKPPAGGGHSAASVPSDNYNNNNNNTSTREAETPKNEEEKPCSPSMFGFLDGICQIPKQKNGSQGSQGGDADANRSAEWGTSPSYEEDESTFPSQQSTTEYSRSYANSQGQGDGYGDGSYGVSRQRSNQFAPIPESPSHDHENFEVVLDSSLLSSPPNSPKRNWFNNNNNHSNSDSNHSGKSAEEVALQSAAPMVPAKPQETQSKRSLVRRLFSGRNKKKEEQPPEETPEEVPEQEEEPEEELFEESEEEEEEEDEKRALHIPEMTTNPPEPLPGRPAQFEPSPTAVAALEHTRSAPPAISGGGGGGGPDPEQDRTTPVQDESADTPSTADDIFSTLGNILSALDPLGGMYDEEKKNEDGEDNENEDGEDNENEDGEDNENEDGDYDDDAEDYDREQESSQPPIEKSFDDLASDVGPDDEIEDNRMSMIPERKEKAAERERSRSVDESPASGKKEKTSRRTLSFGHLAKKISKPFIKKNKDEGTAVDPPGDKPEATSLKSMSSPEESKEAKKKKPKKKKPLWKSTVDPKTGRTYWYNRITRESTYNPPPEAFQSTPKPAEPTATQSEKEPSLEAAPEAAPVSAAASGAAAAAPEATVSGSATNASATLDSPITPKRKRQKPLWKPVVDKNSGRTYYYHRKTRETTWTMPEELKQLAESMAQQQDATPLRKNDTSMKFDEERTEEFSKVDESTKKATPPMMVEAEMTEESQARIHKGERGLLGNSFEMDPDHGMHGDEEDELGETKYDALANKKKEIQRLLNSLADRTPVDQLMKLYAGNEDVLLTQLREKVEARPFDEPVVEISSMPRPSPARMAGRTATFMSKSSAATRSSTITDKTERIRNTRAGRSRGIEPINESLSVATSISSHHREMNVSTPPRRGAVPRERELKVEELTSSRVAAETFDQPGRIVRTTRGPTTDELDDGGSYYGDDEENTAHGTDSVSALSENDADFSNRKENFEQARRRALDDAIEREDWDLAAALSEGMRATNTTTGDFAKAHSAWNQSDLDKFIANNEWDAVKSYIARMREAKKEGHDVAPPPVTKTYSKGERTSESIVRASSSRSKASLPPIGESQSFSKRVGSRSQLQHNNLVSDVSWTSEDDEPSYDSGTEEDEESFDSDYS